MPTAIVLSKEDYAAIDALTTRFFERSADLQAVSNMLANVIKNRLEVVAEREAKERA